MGDTVQDIVKEWIAFLKDEKLWGNDDPIFPATRIKCGASRQFEASGLKRSHWSTATPIRTIFKNAFEVAGLSYFNPHRFRNTLVRFGEQICMTPGHQSNSKHGARTLAMNKS